MNDRFCCIKTNDNNDENEKAKRSKKCVIKWILKLEDYQYALKSTHLKKNINQLEKIKLDEESLRENYEEHI